MVESSADTTYVMELGFGVERTTESVTLDNFSIRGSTMAGSGKFVKNSEKFEFSGIMQDSEYTIDLTTREVHQERLMKVKPNGKFFEGYWYFKNEYDPSKKQDPNGIVVFRLASDQNASRLESKLNPKSDQTLFFKP